MKKLKLDFVFCLFKANNLKDQEYPCDDKWRKWHFHTLLVRLYTTIVQFWKEIWHTCQQNVCIFWPNNSPGNVKMYLQVYEDSEKAPCGTTRKQMKCTSQRTI